MIHTRETQIERLKEYTWDPRGCEAAARWDDRRRM